jgi:hypothetical protein
MANRRNSMRLQVKSHITRLAIRAILSVIPGSNPVTAAMNEPVRTEAYIARTPWTGGMGSAFITGALPAQRTLGCQPDIAKQVEAVSPTGARLEDDRIGLARRKRRSAPCRMAADVARM